MRTTNNNSHHHPAGGGQGQGLNIHNRGSSPQPPQHGGGAGSGGFHPVHQQGSHQHAGQLGHPAQATNANAYVSGHHHHPAAGASSSAPAGGSNAGGPTSSGPKPLHPAFGNVQQRSSTGHPSGGGGGPSHLRPLQHLPTPGSGSGSPSSSYASVPPPQPQAFAQPHVNPNVSTVGGSMMSAHTNSNSSNSSTSHLLPLPQHYQQTGSPIAVQAQMHHQQQQQQFVYVAASSQQTQQQSPQQVAASPAAVVVSHHHPHHQQLRQQRSSSNSNNLQVLQSLSLPPQQVNSGGVHPPQQQQQQYHNQTHSSGNIVNLVGVQLQQPGANAASMPPPLAMVGDNHNVVGMSSGSNSFIKQQLSSGNNNRSLEQSFNNSTQQQQHRSNSGGDVLSRSSSWTSKQQPVLLNIAAAAHQHPSGGVSSPGGGPSPITSLTSSPQQQPSMSGFPLATQAALAKFDQLRWLVETAVQRNQITDLDGNVRRMLDKIDLGHLNKILGRDVKSIKRDSFISIFDSNIVNVSAYMLYPKKVHGHRVDKKMKVGEAASTAPSTSTQEDDASTVTTTLPFGLPLHNHRNMFVWTRVLSGTMSITSYDFAKSKDRQLDHEPMNDDELQDYLDKKQSGGGGSATKGNGDDSEGTASCGSCDHIAPSKLVSIVDDDVESDDGENKNGSKSRQQRSSNSKLRKKRSSGPAPHRPALILKELPPQAVPVLPVDRRRTIKCGETRRLVTPIGGGEVHTIASAPAMPASSSSRRQSIQTVTPPPQHGFTCIADHASPSASEDENGKKRSGFTSTNTRSPSSIAGGKTIVSCAVSNASPPPAPHQHGDSSSGNESGSSGGKHNVPTPDGPLIFIDVSIPPYDKPPHHIPCTYYKEVTTTGLLTQYCSSSETDSALSAPRRASGVSGGGGGILKSGAAGDNVYSGPSGGETSDEGRSRRVPMLPSHPLQGQRAQQTGKNKVVASDHEDATTTQSGLGSVKNATSSENDGGVTSGGESANYPFVSIAAGDDSSDANTDTEAQQELRRRMAAAATLKEQEKPLPSAAARCAVPSGVVLQPASISPPPLPVAPGGGTTTTTAGGSAHEHSSTSTTGITSLSLCNESVTTVGSSSNNNNATATTLFNVLTNADDGDGGSSVIAPPAATASSRASSRASTATGRGSMEAVGVIGKRNSVGSLSITASSTSTNLTTSSCNTVGGLWGFSSPTASETVAVPAATTATTTPPPAGSDSHGKKHSEAVHHVDPTASIEQLLVDEEDTNKKEDGEVDKTVKPTSKTVSPQSEETDGNASSGDQGGSEFISIVDAGNPRQADDGHRTADAEGRGAGTVTIDTSQTDSSQANNITTNIGFLTAAGSHPSSQLASLTSKGQQKVSISAILSGGSNTQLVSTGSTRSQRRRLRRQRASANSQRSSMASHSQLLSNGAIRAFAREIRAERDGGSSTKGGGHECRRPRYIVPVEEPADLVLANVPLPKPVTKYFNSRAATEQL